MGERTKIEWGPVQRHKVPKWFADAKFGMFFHWGPYCVPAYGNEWYSRNMYTKGMPDNLHHEQTYGKLKDFGYKDFYPMWKAEKFDADAWADLIVRSGAKYAGPVTEHCDNFSLWDSKVNPVNSVNYGPHRDIVKECFEAFRKRGIKTLATMHHHWLWGWFMSSDPEADVYDPKNEVYYGPALPLETSRFRPYRWPDEKFCTTWREKVDEVVDRYSPDALYFDGRTFLIREEDRFKMAKHYYEHMGPDAGIITYKDTDFPADIGVYDTERGNFTDGQPFVWQCDDRLENNPTWSIVQDPKYRSARVIIHSLCDIVSKNGNLLLNVGPYADGTFHPDAVKELYAIGDWLSLNGEAIYETRPYKVATEGPTIVEAGHYDNAKVEEQLKTGTEATMEKKKELTARDFRFTTRDGYLYAIAMGWPENGKWEIHTLKEGNEKIRNITLVGHEGPLSYTQTNDALIVQAPAQKPCRHAYALKITLG